MTARPWAEVDLGVVAKLRKRSIGDLRTDMGLLPVGVRGIAWEEGGEVRATALVVDLVPGRRALVQVQGDGAMALIAWMEAESAGTVLEIGVGSELDLTERGYVASNASVKMRSPGPRDPGVIAGTELGIDVVGAPGWVAVANESFAEVPLSAPMTLDEAERALAHPGFDPGLLRFVADDTGVVGYLRAELSSAGIGDIEDMGLVARARGRGWGRWLLRRCEQLLRERGAHEVRLGVAETNTRALALYQREGFVEISRARVWLRQ